MICLLIPFFGCVKRARRRPNFHLPSVPFAHLYGARPEQASLLLAFRNSAQFAPAMARGPSGPAYLALLLPLARGRAGQLIIALLPHIARCSRGAAYHLRGPSGPVCHTPNMPELRRSSHRVLTRSTDGECLIVLSRMVTHAIALMPKTAKCACAANKVNGKVFFCSAILLWEISMASFFQNFPAHQSQCWYYCKTFRSNIPPASSVTNWWKNSNYHYRELCSESYCFSINL